MSVSEDAREYDGTAGFGVATAPGVARCAGVEKDVITPEPAAAAIIEGVDGEGEEAPPATSTPAGVRLDGLFLPEEKSPISQVALRWCPMPKPCAGFRALTYKCSALLCRRRTSPL